MKITKRQLRRIIMEAKGSTKKYDEDSALRGDQSTLPDGLQRAIIDKVVQDREEREEEEREEKNESTRITKSQLRRIIMEVAIFDERDKLLDDLKSNFNISFIRTTEDFGSSEGGIWLSAEHGDKTSSGEPLFNYYDENTDSYEMGVHKEFNDFIKSYGFFAEFYDPGTVMLWRF